MAIICKTLELSNSRDVRVEIRSPTRAESRRVLFTGFTYYNVVVGTVPWVLALKHLVEF